MLVWSSLKPSQVQLQFQSSSRNSLHWDCHKNERTSTCRPDPPAPNQFSTPFWDNKFWKPRPNHRLYRLYRISHVWIPGWTLGRWILVWTCLNHELQSAMPHAMISLEGLASHDSRKQLESLLASNCQKDASKLDSLFGHVTHVTRCWHWNLRPVIRPCRQQILLPVVDRTLSRYQPPQWRSIHSAQKN